ncbi:MAG: bifunctional folylpolyglutamate synthase/dihydrofolate synthase [Agathobacter sp.]|nr:bifunctional folylpolyglutamate synthase/dihydrofolate synthase [Agathobacter sp.]
MNYEEARAYVREVSKTGSVLGLESIERLMDELGNVQNELPIIHIAGTNGKGSTGAYLAAAFAEAGLHVGRYCSPAVFDPLEVWQYDGVNISEMEYANVMSQVKTACDIVVSKGCPAPTVFEVETAAAFVYFSGKKPDVVLLEVGMGGLTDATNVIAKPLASVITTISMDHMQFLGDTLSDIARAKAGIIKEKSPVFCAPQEETAAQVLRQTAEEKKAPITLLEERQISGKAQKPGCLRLVYNSDRYGEFALTTSMAGSYQVRNTALSAETAAYCLAQLKPQESEKQHKRWICDGIAKTVWPGRFEVLGNNPLFVLDGAHNEDAAYCLEKTVQNCFTNTKLVYIIGVLADKEHEKMLKIMLPHAKRVYTVTPHNPRALKTDALAKEAALFCESVNACESVEEAVTSALRDAKSMGLPVLAFGSLSYLKECRDAYQKAMRKNL